MMLVTIEVLLCYPLLEMIYTIFIRWIKCMGVNVSSLHSSTGWFETAYGYF